MTHRSRILRALGTLLPAVVAAGVVGISPAHAASTVTWTGAGTTNHWGDPGNWDTGSVPTSSDTVVIHSLAGQNADVEAVGNRTVANLVLAGGENDTFVGSDGLGSLTVTHSMTWTGGALGLPLSVPSGATLTFASGSDKLFTSPSGQITVAGTAVVDHTGTGASDAVEFWWDSGLTVVPGGTLTSHGTAQLTGNRCCGEDFPSAVDNAGTIAVPDGTLRLSTMGLNQHGTVNVSRGATLASDKGLVRLETASYAGPGRMLITNTVSPTPQPDHRDRNQGAATLLGTSTLSDGFQIVAGRGTEIAGVGTIGGTGQLTVNQATVFARLHLAGSVALRVPGGAQAWAWTQSDADGYHAQITLDHGGSIGVGGHLTLHPGTRTTVAGGTLWVGTNGIIDSDSCCTTTPTLVNNAAGQLVFSGKGLTAPATLKWVTLLNRGRLRANNGVRWNKATVTQTGGTTTTSGQLDASGSSVTLRAGTFTGTGTFTGDLANSAGTVRPTGILNIHGDYTQGGSGTFDVHVGSPATRLLVSGKAHLSGTLHSTASSTTSYGVLQRVLTAGTRTGTFTCARTGAFLPTYGTSSVWITRYALTGKGCLHYLKPSTRLSATVRQGHPVGFSASFSSSATQALFRVTATSATSNTTVSITARNAGHAQFGVARGQTRTRYLVVPVGAVHSFLARSSAGSVRVSAAIVGWYR